MIVFTQIGRQIPTKERITIYIIFSQYVDVGVLENFAGSLKQRPVALCYRIDCKVEFNRYPRLFLSIRFDGNVYDFLILEVVWILCKRSIKRIRVHETDNHSIWHLFHKQVFLDGIVVSSRNEKCLAFHAPNGIRRICKF